MALAALLCALWLAAAAPASAQAQPDLVLITLDTTRADHLGAWGWPHARTPNLDALAGRGSRFARCDTAVPVTLPSHASILTGIYPPRHGVRDNATFTLPDSAETVSERLAGAGWDTAAVVSSFVLGRRYGTAQGFRLYDDDLGPGAAAGTVARESPAGRTTDRALAMLERLERPFFLWVHYFDPHEPYAAPAGWAEKAGGPHAAYDGEIAYLDQELGRLLASLPQGAKVVVAGDHGEMLGDHGEPTHGVLLHHGARRVPLILSGSGIPEGRTVDCLVRTVDVAPTLLELTGLTPAAGLDGASLLPLLEDGAACDRSSYAESFQPFFAHRWYPLRAFSDGRWLYVHGKRPGLYDLREDAAESEDVSAAEPAVVERLHDTLAESVEAMGSELEAGVETGRTLSAEEERQLRSLGYVGGGGGQADVGAELPDPRDMMEVAQAIHRAGLLVESGRCNQALPLLVEVTRRDDRSFPAHNMAGLCLQATGRLESALNAFRRASALAPEAVEPVVNAGACLLQLGRLQEAEAVYRNALDLDPTAPGVASNLAALLRQRQEPAEAAEVLATALDAGARYAALFVERGILSGQSGDVPAALRDFDQAAGLDPGNPDALANAARAALMLGRTADAAERFEKLTELVPNDPGLWFTLGRIYLEALGDHQRGEQCLRRALELEPDPAKKAQIQGLLDSR